MTYTLHKCTDMLYCFLYESLCCTVSWISHYQKVTKIRMTWFRLLCLFFWTRPSGSSFWHELLFFLHRQRVSETWFGVASHPPRQSWCCGCAFQLEDAMHNEYLPVQFHSQFSSVSFPVQFQFQNLSFQDILPLAQNITGSNSVF